LIYDKSYSRVSGAYDHEIDQGKILDFWKSYARDVCPSILLKIIIDNKLSKFQELLNDLLSKFEAKFILHYIKSFNDYRVNYYYNYNNNLLLTTQLFFYTY
jgi:hypothetical protein